MSASEEALAAKASTQPPFNLRGYKGPAQPKKHVALTGEMC